MVNATDLSFSLRRRAKPSSKSSGAAPFAMNNIGIPELTLPELTEHVTEMKSLPGIE